MDDFDRKILRVVQIEPQIGMAELAGRVGLSHTPCWRRLRKLEADGYIVGRTAMLDARKLGWPVNVIAQLKISRHGEDELEAFESQIHAHPQIQECFSMSGESDYVLRIVAASIEDYEQFLKKVLLHLPGVSAVNSSFALKTIKLTTALPI